MSNTRHAAEGSPLHQGRYASSPEFERGLLAPLVAKRCSLLDSADDRALIWMLQKLSWTVGLQHVADAINEMADRHLGTPSMHRFGIRDGAFYNAEQVKAVRADLPVADHQNGRFLLKGEWSRADRLRENSAAIRARGFGEESCQDAEAELKELRHKVDIRPNRYPVNAFLAECRGARGHLADHLAELCLDPQFGFESCWYYNLRAVLRDYMAAESGRVRAGVVVTEIGRRVYDAMDYATQQRCLVLIAGKSRTGKSFSAKQFCMERPVSLRYVEVPSCHTETGFFTSIGTGLGITIESNAKATKLRDRCNAVLKSGDITLVLDEADRLLPSYISPRGLPSRLTWVMEMVNDGDGVPAVPIVLVTTPAFFQRLAAVVKQSGWASEQFLGRIGHYEQLPDSLSESDLQAVAQSRLPEGSKEDIQALVDYAQGSARYLQAIDAVVNRARYVAKRAGRSHVIKADIKQAIKQSVIPSDSALAEALESSTKGRAPSRLPRLRSIPAAPLPDGGQAAAATLPARSLTPAAPIEFPARTSRADASAVLTES